MNFRCLLLCNCVSGLLAYWDVGTTTEDASNWRTDQYVARTSRFRWQRSEHHWYRLLYPWWNWTVMAFRRRLYVVAGISYEMVNLGTAAILNRRSVLTAANLLDPYMHDPSTVRVWALGRSGGHNMPWRYRAFQITRVQPRSANPEHCHGPWCFHTPRHDVCVIHTLDQMYIFHEISPKYAYATRTYLTKPYTTLQVNDLYFTGSGYEYHAHVVENYKIFYTHISMYDIVDCSSFVLKWWGKFICFVNNRNFPGIQNGGPLFNYYTLVGLGCYMHTYQDSRYFVFTDLRYYVWWIYQVAAINPGMYYEYAYPEWGTTLRGWDDDRDLLTVSIPTWQLRDTIYPLGKK